MDSIQVTGNVDEQRRLIAIVPAAIPPGPVTFWIERPEIEDDAGNSWLTGIVRESSDDLTDERQDVYSLDDGEPVDPA